MGRDELYHSGRNLDYLVPMSDPRFSPSRPCPLRDIARWDFETDVIVIGFGAAGASAAIEARTAGAEVLLFEVASGSGGTSSMAGGDIYLGGGGGTDVQRAAGYEDATEDFYRYMKMAGGPDADEERTRLYAENALAHFDWLKAQGVRYRLSHLPGKVQAPGTGDCLIWSGNEIAWPFHESAKPCPRGHLPEVVGEMGMEALHAGAGAADTPEGPWTGVFGVDRRIALAGIRRVRAFELRRVDLGLRTLHPARRLEPPDEPTDGRVDQPVPGRHRSPVVEDRSVAKDRRRTVDGADHDLEPTLRSPPEQPLDLGEIVRIHPSPGGGAGAGDVRERGSGSPP